MRLPALFPAEVGPGRARAWPLGIAGARLRDAAGLSALRSDCCLLVRGYVLKSTTALASGWGLRRLLRHQ